MSTLNFFHSEILNKSKWRFIAKKTNFFEGLSSHFLLSSRVHSRFGTLFTISRPQPLHEISLDVFTLLAIDWENLMKRIVIGNLDGTPYRDSTLADSPLLEEVCSNCKELYVNCKPIKYYR